MFFIKSFKNDIVFNEDVYTTVEEVRVSPYRPFMLRPNMFTAWWTIFPRRIYSLTFVSDRSLTVSLLHL